MARKVIGLVTAGAENVYAKRLIDGVCLRCQHYGYDLAVFFSPIPVGSTQEKYTEGEFNIYNLINHHRLDGIIVDGPSLMETFTKAPIPHVTHLLEKDLGTPVVAAGCPIGDLPAYVPSDRPVMKDITLHVIDRHNCRDIYFLGGMEGNVVTLDRLHGFADALAERGIPFDEKKVFYGDFWYFSGAELAMRILSGQLPRPQAIVCANDHMAIGLANRLTENGLRVPEDIIITGYDATQDAAINKTTITSIPANAEGAAVSAVDHLRQLMEPGAPLAPYTPSAACSLQPGMSCGCNPDMTQIMDQFRASFYNFNYDYASADTRVDLGMLMESSLVEYLSDCESPQDCIRLIYNRTYLLDRYDDFYLCLDENWLNADLCCRSGYPGQMHMVLHNTPEMASGHYKNGPMFPTEVMLPDLGSESREPSVFFFMPVHFLNLSLGYAVLRYAHTATHQMTCVIRHWLKNVASGLHISRTAHRLESLSTRDGMTGAYNRRGMELMLDQMLRRAAPDDSVLAFVIDMDRLKYINDTYGHADGDLCINAVCRAAESIARKGEMVVRAGGDEFYVVGIGAYNPQDSQERITAFYQALEKAGAALHKPYALSASIGSACVPLSSGMTVMGIIRIADAKMYENKVQKKLQRKD